tara:strand:- start:353 stop:592 length:240 start_codon:yes stop_codon:yes gene_type:complete
MNPEHKLNACIKIYFNYGDGKDESLFMTAYEAEHELMSFLNHLSDSGKRQWMAKMKGKTLSVPWQDEHYKTIGDNFSCN